MRSPRRPTKPALRGCSNGSKRAGLFETSQRPLRWLTSPREARQLPRELAQRLTQLGRVPNAKRAVQLDQISRHEIQLVYLGAEQHAAAHLLQRPHVRRNAAA